MSQYKRRSLDSRIETEDTFEDFSVEVTGAQTKAFSGGRRSRRLPTLDERDNPEIEIGRRPAWWGTESGDEE